MLFRSPDRPTLWTFCYLDNYIAGNPAVWSGSPFALRVDGDLFYGKGVQDNNDGIAAALLLYRALHNHESIIPVNFGIIMLSGEKELNGVGFDHVIAQRPGLLKKTDHYFIISYGGEDGDRIGVGEKALMWLKITLNGKQTHSGMSDTSKNSLVAGADLIMRLGQLYDLFPAVNPLFEQPTSTFIPTKPEAPETASNQVPGEFAFHLDTRILSEYHPDQIYEAVEKIAAPIAEKYGVGIDVKRYMLSLPAPITDAETPVVLALSNAIQAQLGRKARLYGVGGVSLASNLRRAGYPTAVWQMAPMVANAPDEFMSVSANLAEAAIMARLVFDPALAIPAPELNAAPGVETEQ